MSLSTREQMRAQKAYELTKAISEKPKAKKYGTFVLAMPILLRTSGLMATIEYARQKEERVVNDIKQHLVAAGLIGAKDDVCERIRKASLQEYMRLTREVHSILT